jgi:hypothetical protein
MAAAAGSASAQVYKSVGADGKVIYSDHPSDKANVSVSVIKADIVQVVAAATPRTVIVKDAGPSLAALTAALAHDAKSQELLRATAADKKVCDKMVTVVVDRNGQIVRSLGPTNLLAGFKTR